MKKRTILFQVSLKKLQKKKMATGNNPKTITTNILT